MGLMAMPATAGQGQLGYRGGRRSPVAIGGAVAVHVALAAAFLLMPREAIAPYVPPILIANQIPLDPPPPPEPETTPKSSRMPDRPVIDKTPVTPDTDVDLPDFRPGSLGGDPLGDRIGGGDVILPPADPPRDPVTTDPSIDPRALGAFQPDYPGAMVRQGIEGTVTVRVTIGPDGRVTDIERLSATDEAFWLATQRHALRKWRFRPATRDGVAISSSKVLTVHFQLTDR